MRSTVVCLVYLFVASMSAVFAQTPQPPPPADRVPVFYTGRLLGYFRNPEVQSRTSDMDCPKNLDRASEAVKAFLKLRESEPGTLLVGVGDNFSPELYSRTFAPEGETKTRDPKDRYIFNFLTKDPKEQKWITNQEAFQQENLMNQLAAGNGRIPMDNVACFLKLARYNAIVPGKHDFYFGPERLRELARFLMSVDTKVPAEVKVPMLAANLSIVTTVPDAPPRVPAPKMSLPYLTEFRGIKVELPSVVLPWKRTFVIKNLVDIFNPQKRDKDGKPSKVAPADLESTSVVAKGEAPLSLLSTASFVMHPKDPSKDISTALGPYSLAPKVTGVFLCPADDDDPFKLALPPPFESHALKAGQCLPLKEASRVPKKEVEEAKNSLGLTDQNNLTDSKFQRVTGFPTESTHNYGICMVLVQSDKMKEKEKNRPLCFPFSVHEPFFQRGTPPNGQRDPPPFALSNDKKVAIFGIVDPDMANGIGELNDAWLNTKHEHKYETKIEVSDPQEALQQLFDECQEDPDCSKSARKILLAQMPAYKAAQLAVKLPKFDLIVAQTDQAHETGEETYDRTLQTGNAPGFIVVPEPMYKPPLDAAKNFTFKVNLQKAELTPAPQKCTSGCKWKLTSVVLRNNTGFPIEPADNQSGRRQKGSLHPCLDQTSCALREAAALAISPGEYDDLNLGDLSGAQLLQHLGLLVMRKTHNADIALLQKRDLFEPALHADLQVSAANLQDLIDRIFWKDDFVVRETVTGSTIKAILARSKQFDAQDSNVLSPELQLGSGLIALGVFTDPETQTLIIDGAPIDDARLYSVAMTDFLAFGDTGYPELQKPAVPPAERLKDFKVLYDLSGAVCAQIKYNVKDLKEANCNVTRIDASPYFDASNQKPFDGTPGYTPWRRFGAWLRPDLPHNAYKNARVNELEKAVQQRPVWSVVLEALDVSFSMNEHNNGTEGNVASRFSGVPVAQVTTPDSDTVALDYKIRLKRTAQYLDAFAFSELDYSQQLTRQSNNTYLKNLKTNMAAVESGIYPRLWPRRKETPDLKGLFSVRYQTQLVDSPVSFSLNDSAKSSLPGFTDPTKLLLAKNGFRFQQRKSWVEAGYEWGGNFNTPVAFLFNPGLPTAITCNASAGQGPASLATCVTTNSTVVGGSALITPTSTFIAVTRDRFQHGLFFNFQLTAPLPFGKDRFYVMSNTGDIFFNRSDDVSLDTRYFDKWSHSFVIPLFGNLSFVPKADIFFYQNKIDNHSFRSIQTSVSLQYRFDWHEGISLGQALKYPNPAPK